MFGKIFDTKVAEKDKLYNLFTQCCSHQLRRPTHESERLQHSPETVPTRVPRLPTGQEGINTQSELIKRTELVALVTNLIQECLHIDHSLCANCANLFVLVFVSDFLHAPQPRDSLYLFAEIFILFHSLFSGDVDLILAVRFEGYDVLVRAGLPL